jgi:hypothetical protein
MQINLIIVSNAMNWAKWTSIIFLFIYLIMLAAIYKSGQWDTFLENQKFDMDRVSLSFLTGGSICVWLSRILSKYKIALKAWLASRPSSKL